MMPLGVEHRGRDARVWTKVLDAASALGGLTEPHKRTVLPDDTAIHKTALGRWKSASPRTRRDATQFTTMKLDT
jgi:hypothetical protein